MGWFGFRLDALFQLHAVWVAESSGLFFNPSFFSSRFKDATSAWKALAFSFDGNHSRGWGG
jgi:hypothetical protein